MPLTAKGEKILANLEKEYGKEKGEQVLYAGKNKGTFTGIDDACSRMDASIKAMRSRMDDHRVLGGVGFRAPTGRADAKEAEHTLEVTFDGDFDMAGLVRALHYLGGVGASRTLDIAIDDRDTQGDLKKKGIPSKLGWDGDGADKIRSCTIDGVDILK